MSSQWTKRTKGFLLIAAVLGACDARGPEPEVASSERALVGGTVDDGDPSVVAVMVAGSPNICTGTVVGVRSVLTSAHCVAGAGPWQVIVLLGTLAPSSPPPLGIPVREVLVDPLGRDVAMLGLWSNVPPQAAPIPLAVGPPAPGQRARIVGFGPPKQSAAAVIEEVSAGALVMEASACDADRGGPALIVQDGNEVVAGTLTGYDPSCASAAYQRVDVLAADFIVPFILAHGGFSTDCLPDSPPPTISCPPMMRPLACGEPAVFPVSASGCGTVTVACDPPQGASLRAPTPVTCTATDGNHHQSRPCAFLAPVIDVAGPVVTVHDVILAGPFNHKHRSVDLRDCVSGVRDACDVDLDVDDIDAAGRIEIVRADEAEDDRLAGTTAGDAATCGDILIDSPHSVGLRAEAAAPGNGRVYTIELSVADSAGNRTRASCNVSVAPPPLGFAVRDACAYCVERPSDPPLGVCSASCPMLASSCGPGTPSAVVAGTVTETFTGAPMGNVTVSINELPGFTATTGADGHFRIATLPIGTHTLHLTTPKGIETTPFRRTSDEQISLAAGLNQREIAVTRNWAWLGQARQLEGVDPTRFGFGPAAAIDGAEATAWVNSGPLAAWPATSMLLRLPAAVDVAGYAVEGGARPPGYDSQLVLEVSGDDTAFSSSASAPLRDSGSVGYSDPIQTVTARPGATGVTLVKAGMSPPGAPAPGAPPTDVYMSYLREFGVYGAGMPAPPRVIYLNRHGGIYRSGPNDPIANTSPIANPPPGSDGIPPFEDDAAWNALVSCVSDLFAPFDVTVTDVEPGIEEQVEVVVGGRPEDIGQDPSSTQVGLSDLTCRPSFGAVAFVFAEKLAEDTADPLALCITAAHEAAHAYGLDHTLLPCDPMSYLSCPSPRARWDFPDTWAPCGERDSPRTCSCTGAPMQSSYQFLLGVLGPRR